MTRFSILLLTAVALAPSVHAQDNAGAGKTPVAAPETSGNQGAPDAVPSIQSSLGAYGDPGGLRAFLHAKGIDYSFTYIGEVLGNSSGGVKRGATYEGRLDAVLDANLETLADLKGAALHAEAFQIHGRGLSGNNTLDVFTVSNIEAVPSTRLYEAWFEQKLADDKLAVRVGELGVDTEFLVSQTANLFVNATFGWPAVPANDLPSGGPAYPLSALGTRIKVTPLDNVTVLAAVFDGDPAGPYRPGFNDPNPQVRDNRGTNFRLNDPPLLITEVAYAYNQDKNAAGLPGTVKVGYLHHFGQFAALDTPLSINYRGNDGLYGVLDQTIYRVPGTDDQGASVFLRVVALPSDRNPMDVYVDGGVSYKGLIPGRPDDTVGLAAAYGRSSPNLAQITAQTPGALVPDYQATLEATYQFTVVPGFTVQPDFQYIFHPGAHAVADPVDGRPIRDAAVFGLRTTIHY